MYLAKKQWSFVFNFVVIFNKHQFYISFVGSGSFLFGFWTRDPTLIWNTGTVSIKIRCAMLMILIIFMIGDKNYSNKKK